MKIPLNIETNDRRLGFDIVGREDSLRSGTVLETPGGAKMEFHGFIGRKEFGAPEVLQFILDASVSVDLGLLAAWLYDKVKDRKVNRIVINRRIVTEISERGIRQTLEEEIRSSE